MTRRIGATMLAALVLAVPAHAATFRVGLVNPTPVPAGAATQLGATVQRYDLRWGGERAFHGSLVLGTTTRPVLSLYPASGVYSAAVAPAFCAWVGSVLDRYPVARVIVGNEPPPGNPVGYAAVLAACAPIVHAHGAMVIGPGMVPAGGYVVQTFLDAIAASGARLDAFDVHPYWYSGLVYDRDVVARVHATLGARVRVWASEDGVQSIVPGWDTWYSVDEATQARAVAADMIDARCAGMSVWLNFLYVDQDTPAGWQSGLVRPDGTHKPAFDAFAAASRSTWCPATMPTTPPPAPAPTSNAALASRLGEVGGWARDAYEAQP